MESKKLRREGKNLTIQKSTNSSLPFATVLLRIKNKIAKETNATILRLLEHIKQGVATLTFDNGREFSRHSEPVKRLECETYFAKPYHSWERGLNENHNGLLRQFFPKKMPLHKVTEKELLKATDLMNNRPRKCLEVKKPWEVCSHALGIDHNIIPSVALMDRIRLLLMTCFIDC